MKKCAIGKMPQQDEHYTGRMKLKKNTQELPKRMQKGEAMRIPMPQ
ncbi:hypothetical protein [Neisseria gonorrhoeae]|nr:hypothetical protein [Neisseria gonorrhoeae]